MNFYKYIGVTKEEFIGGYLDTGLVSEQVHKEFPLAIYTYGRRAVHENIWDGVTSRCRGIIVNRETDEVVARPFEKFHNYGSSTGCGFVPEFEIVGEPTIIEKMDGFMCTLYRWEGKSYIASKGSFHSVHAKWATAEYNKIERPGFPEGWTPVFEGLCRDLRIVVDYGNRTGLVLLGLIHNETGQEVKPDELARWGKRCGFETPTVMKIPLKDAVDVTRQEDYIGEEGYVLTWFHPNQPPYRLKLKYVEYLRLHRMVTGVSPKRIWEVLSQAHLKADLDEYINNSTPWFNKFVTKWVNALTTAHARLMTEASARFYAAKDVIRNKYDRCELEFSEIRKAFAEEFLKPENKEFSSIMFGLLDGKDASMICWKKVRELTKDGHPMVDIHSL